MVAIHEDRKLFEKVNDKTKKGASHKYVNRPYEKSKCHICDQICYNKEDLQLHLKYNHPDVQSAPAS
jgi:hypothetical protein